MMGFRKYLFLFIVAISGLILFLLHSFTLAALSTFIRPYNYPISATRIRQAADDTFFDSLDEKVGQALITRLECREPVYNRYESLRGHRTFIALNLHDSQEVLPTLLHALMGTIRFLGPSNVFLSIYEGGSGDMSPSVIQAAAEFFWDMGLGGLDVNTDSMAYDFGSMNRIHVLATYRNLALKSLKSIAVPPETILFVNDIYVCTYQILELLHQHVTNTADIACGFDWERNGVFYDSWVARDITGHLFSDIPDQGFAYSMDMFPHSPPDRERFERGEPFQVYSCWNGMLTLNPKPFLEHDVMFRRSREGECSASEATLISKDFWTYNFSRVMVVPSINVAYTLPSAKDQQGKEISKMLWNGEVSFTTTPPEKVSCRPWPEEVGLWAQPGPWTTTYWVDAVDDLDLLGELKGKPTNLQPDGNYPKRFGKRRLTTELEEKRESEPDVRALEPEPQLKRASDPLDRRRR